MNKVQVYLGLGWGRVRSGGQLTYLILILTDILEEGKNSESKPMRMASFIRAIATEFIRVSSYLNIRV